MSVTDALTLLIEELAGDVPDPLAERLTLATIWSDLARIAGEPVPMPVRLLIDGPPEGQMPLPPA